MVAIVRVRVSCDDMKQQQQKLKLNKGGAYMTLEILTSIGPTIFYFFNDFHKEN